MGKASGRNGRQLFTLLPELLEALSTCIPFMQTSVLKEHACLLSCAQQLPGTTACCVSACITLHGKYSPPLQLATRSPGALAGNFSNPISLPLKYMF